MLTKNFSFGLKWPFRLPPSRVQKCTPFACNCPFQAINCLKGSKWDVLGWQLVDRVLFLLAPHIAIVVPCSPQQNKRTRTSTCVFEGPQIEPDHQPTSHKRHKIHIDYLRQALPWDGSLRLNEDLFGILVPKWGVKISQARSYWFININLLI